MTALALAEAMTLPELALLAFLADDTRRCYRTRYLAECLRKTGWTIDRPLLGKLQKEGSVLKQTEATLTEKDEYWSASREGQAAMTEGMILLEWYTRTKVEEISE